MWRTRTRTRTRTKRVGAKPARARGEGRIVIRECNAVFPPAGASLTARRGRAHRQWRRRRRGRLAHGGRPAGRGRRRRRREWHEWAPSWQECEVRAASARDHASAVHWHGANHMLTFCKPVVESSRASLPRCCRTKRGQTVVKKWSNSSQTVVESSSRPSDAGIRHTWGGRRRGRASAGQRGQ